MASWVNTQPRGSSGTEPGADRMRPGARRFLELIPSNSFSNTGFLSNSIDIRRNEFTDLAGGAIMVGDEMVDEAGRKMALTVRDKAEAAGIWTGP